MIWQVRAVKNERFSLLLSDRPLVRTTVLGHARSHLVLPISPHCIFIACNTDEELDFFEALSDRSLIMAVNKASVSQASRMAYSVDEIQNAFVAKHLAKAPLESAHEQYAKRRAKLV